MNYVNTIVFLVLCSVSAAWQSRSTPTENDMSVLLRTWLSQYTGVVTRHFDPYTRYAEAFVDLNRDGALDALVYLTGPAWCGSGGCTLLVVQFKDGKLTLVSHITIVRPPVLLKWREAETGWPSLVVTVAGGGVAGAYTAQLAYDGMQYPQNPTRPPSARYVADPVAREQTVFGTVIRNDAWKQVK